LFFSFAALPGAQSTRPRAYPSSREVGSPGREGRRRQPRRSFKMNAFRHRAVLALILPCLGLIAAPSLSQQAGFSFRARVGVPAATTADYQILTTGPLHEGYARPIVYTGVQPVYVQSTPPELISEVAPLERPEGAAEWVPGYWSFDDQSQRWIWVSGSWRVAP